MLWLEHISESLLRTVASEWMDPLSVVVMQIGLVFEGVEDRYWNKYSEEEQCTLLAHFAHPQQHIPLLLILRSCVCWKFDPLKTIRPTHVPRKMVSQLDADCWVLEWFENAKVIPPFYAELAKVRTLPWLWTRIRHVGVRTRLISSLPPQTESVKVYTSATTVGVVEQSPQQVLLESSMIYTCWPTVKSLVVGVDTFIIRWRCFPAVEEVLFEQILLKERIQFMDWDFAGSSLKRIRQLTSSVVDPPEGDLLHLEHVDMIRGQKWIQFVSRGQAPKLQSVWIDYVHWMWWAAKDTAPLSSITNLHWFLFSEWTTADMNELFVQLERFPHVTHCVIHTTTLRDTRWIAPSVWPTQLTVLYFEGLMDAPSILRQAWNVLPSTVTNIVVNGETVLCR